MAEAAAHRHGLDDALKPRRQMAKVALSHCDKGEELETWLTSCAPPRPSPEVIREIKESEEVTRGALDLLSSGRNDVNETAWRLCSRIRGTGGLRPRIGLGASALCLDGWRLSVRLAEVVHREVRTLSRRTSSPAVASLP